MNSTKTASFVLWFMLTCLVGSGMYILKNQVQNLERELYHINQNIQKDVKSIHVLKAEWSHLNSPSRLRKLANKHILLNQVRPEQIINYSALPFEYQTDDNSRRLLAQQQINSQAARNKQLKKLARAQR